MRVCLSLFSLACLLACPVRTTFCFLLRNPDNISPSVRVRDASPVPEGGISSARDRKQPRLSLMTPTSAPRKQLLFHLVSSSNSFTLTHHLLSVLWCLLSSFFSTPKVRTPVSRRRRVAKGSSVRRTLPCFYSSFSGGGFHLGTRDLHRNFLDYTRRRHDKLPGTD